MQRKFRSETAARKVAKVLGMQIKGKGKPSHLKDGTKAKTYTFVKVTKKKVKGKKR